MTKLTNTDSPSVEVMIRFTSRSSLNSILPTFPRDKEEAALIEGLTEAIRLGQSDNPLFLNPNASLCVLYLMKNEAISLYEGWTTLSYLMALAQFSENQPLRSEDMDIRVLSNKKIEVLSFSDGDSPEINEYLSTLAKRKLRFSFDVSTFYRQLSTLSSTEKWLIKIPLTEENVTPKQLKQIIVFLKNNLCKNLPLVQLYHDSYLLIPSFSAISIYFKLINPELNILAAPIYGTIKEETLLDFHQHRFHPIAFYSTLIKSNLSLVHNRRAGLIPAMLHDFLHIFMALQLTKKEYDFVFDYLIPLLQEFAEKFKKDKALAEKCTEAIVNLSDLDLTFYGGFKGFSYYVRSSLNIYESCENEFVDVGSCIEDNFYFLLLQRFKQDMYLLKNKYGFDKFEYLLAATGVLHRKNDAVEMIQTLAKQSSASSLAEALSQQNNQPIIDSPIVPFLTSSTSYNFFKNHLQTVTAKNTKKFGPSLINHIQAKKQKGRPISSLISMYEGHEINPVLYSKFYCDNKNDSNDFAVLGEKKGINL